MRERRPRRRIGLAALAAVPVFLLLGPAAVPPALAATSLHVTGAYDGSYVPGRPMAVRVQITADRLVRGRLEVSTAEGTPVGLPVEVPGGSSKEFLVVLPAWLSFNFDGAVGVQARLRDGSTDIATGDAILQSSTGQELVGLLPGALGGRSVPGAAPLAVDAGTAHFAALGPAELAQAPDSLGPVSTIAAAADELVRLPAATRTALLAWVEQGGHLLVDADRGQTRRGRTRAVAARSGRTVPRRPGRDQAHRRGHRRRTMVGTGGAHRVGRHRRSCGSLRQRLRGSVAGQRGRAAGAPPGLAGRLPRPLRAGGGSGRVPRRPPSGPSRAGLGGGASGGGDVHRRQLRRRTGPARHHPAGRHQHRDHRGQSDGRHVDGRLLLRRPDVAAPLRCGMVPGGRVRHPETPTLSPASPSRPTAPKDRYRSTRASSASFPRPGRSWPRARSR